MTAKPWTLKVGNPCSFYHEGGSGDRHWVNGWRYGVIRKIVERGQKKNWAMVEVPATRQYTINAWCHINAINEPLDCIYHGPRLDEVVRERKQAKRVQQAKADKRKRKAA